MTWASKGSGALPTEGGRSLRKALVRLLGLVDFSTFKYSSLLF